MQEFIIKYHKMNVLLQKANKKFVDYCDQKWYDTLLYKDKFSQLQSITFSIEKLRDIYKEKIYRLEQKNGSNSICVYYHNYFLSLKEY